MSKTVQMRRDEIIGALQPEEDLLVADTGQGFVNVAVMRQEEAVGVIAALMAPGWLTVMAPAIGYQSGLNADMIGQLFTQSMSMGPLRFFLATDGAHLRLDVPLALGEDAWLDAIRRLGRALHGLYDHDAGWMMPPRVDRVPLNTITEWLAQLDDVNVESIGENQWRLVDQLGAQSMPVALEVDETLGQLRLMCGVIQLSEEQFEPSHSATFMKMNDKIFAGKLVGVPEHGALMYVMDVPSAWLTTASLNAYWSQILNDQMILRSLFSDVPTRFEQALETMLTQAESVGVAESVLASQFMRLARGESLDEEVDRHEALGDAVLDVAEYLFRVIPHVLPQMMSVMPMHLETVAQGQASMRALPEVLRTYWPQAPDGQMG